ncbi:hypothetical protein Taro_016078, partial [Colocasia esculenta]|nr:hypothetical protein [Colocasia esculenta]
VPRGQKPPRWGVCRGGTGAADGPGPAGHPLGVSRRRNTPAGGVCSAHRTPPLGVSDGRTPPQGVSAHRTPPLGVSVGRTPLLGVSRAGTSPLGVSWRKNHPAGGGPAQEHPRWGCPGCRNLRGGVFCAGISGRTKFMEFCVSRSHEMLAALWWEFNVAGQPLSLLVKKHFVNIFAICMALCCSSKAEKEAGEVVLSSSILQIAEISEHERDDLIKKYMLCRDNCPCTAGIIDKLNIFRPDRVFKFLVEIHYLITSAIHPRHKCNRLSAVEVLVKIIGHRATVSSTSLYVFNLVGQFIVDPALQDQCCAIVSTLLLSFRGQDLIKDGVNILGEQLQLLISKLVVCYSHDDSTTSSVASSSKIVSLLEQLVVDADSSLYDYIRIGIGDPHRIVFHLPGNAIQHESYGRYAHNNAIADETTIHNGLGVSEEVLINLLGLLKKYLLDDGVAVVDIAARTLRGILSSELGYRALLTFNAYDRSLISVHSRGVNSQLVEKLIFDCERKSISAQLLNPGKYRDLNKARAINTPGTMRSFGKKPNLPHSNT